jgi:hypothetical protein
MQARVAMLAFALSVLATGATAEAGPTLHDCLLVTDARSSVSADAGGLSLQLSAPAARLYPARAQRMDKQARVSLQCIAVTDRPMACAVTHESLAGFGFGSAAVAIAQSGRLAAPAGVWPFEVDVSFRYVVLTNPIFVGYC